MTRDYSLGEFLADRWAIYRSRWWPRTIPFDRVVATLRPNINTYRTEWSEDDGEWVGLVAEYPSLSWLAPTEAEALAGIKTLDAQVAADIILEGLHAEALEGFRIHVLADVHRMDRMWVGELAGIPGEPARAKTKRGVRRALRDEVIRVAELPDSADVRIMLT